MYIDDFDPDDTGVHRWPTTCMANIDLQREHLIFDDLRRNGKATVTQLQHAHSINRAAVNKAVNGLRDKGMADIHGHTESGACLWFARPLRFTREEGYLVQV